MIPELHEPTKLSDKLIYSLDHINYEIGCAYFQFMPALLFHLFQVCQHGHYPSAKKRKLHDGPLRYIILWLSDQK